MPKTTPTPARALGLAETAAALAEADAHDVIHIATDDPRAAALADLLPAFAPDRIVLFCPGSDALPGDASPPSPANAGLRVAALHRARMLAGQADRPGIILVTTGEATAWRYAAPEAFDATPPAIHAGTTVDLPALADELTSLGYVTTEEVTEPGEIALRGQVLDVFPADAAQPMRIEREADGVTLRGFDAITQLTTGHHHSIELGRVTEPAIGTGVSLIAHLPDAKVSEEPRAATNRRRLLDLARDAGENAIAQMVGVDAWAAQVGGRGQLDLAVDVGEPPPRFAEQRAPLRQFARVAGLARAAGERVVLIGSARDLRFLRRRVGKALGTEPDDAAGWADVVASPAGGVSMLTAPADRGFRRSGIVAIAAADLLGSRAERNAGEQAAPDLALFGAGAIGLGDVVVHQDHGMAVVEGLETLAGDGGDAIVLRHAGDTRRLVPVAEADRLWRYGADADAVTLDKLDGSSWTERRRAADEAIAETARALTALAAARTQRTAPVLDPDPAAYERFTAAFPYGETPDQVRAIAAVRADLASGRPMDRLVVGDVGYGKTEVALRAAAIAALAGRQVALAAPTTVLARQHLETFRARFEGTGVKVAGLSRLTSEAEKRRVLNGLADGSIGIAIGTAAVAGKAVRYNDLALVVLDEEQRFGAADKARLRALSAGHVLTLTATPIPRTLQSALVGLQDLSIIATPPARRQPIRTAVETWTPALVRTALLRERARRGQSFVVVPRVEDMGAIAADLARLVPELAVTIAHGKLPAADVDRAMVDFAGGRGDVLLATNIIEAGLDVPRANTMIVWRADRFGLAQLHQLRGRVGRGARRGQVYLTTEPGADVAPRTLARLKTLQTFDRLGAGFAISARDLDLRGAGDLLGEAQAGHSKLIGIDLYQHLLEGALRSARGEVVEDWTPELNLDIAGCIPADWVPDEELRLSLYARLARIADDEALDAFEDELDDRFGAPPDAARSLLSMARVRLLAREHDVARIDAGPAAVAFTPRGTTRLAVRGGETKEGRVIVRERTDNAADRLALVQRALTGLDQLPV